MLGATKKDESDNRWWQIFEHLDNLKSTVEDKATKIGDHLISEEIADEQKRLRKQEMES